MHVVLVEPEIPPNTGNVARLCAATHTALHLVEPLGFKLGDAQLKRAGMDYWQHVEWHRWPDWQAFRGSLRADARLWFVESNGPRLYTEADFAPGDYLVFGRETAGLPKALLAANRERWLRIPMFNASARSLNLSNCVALVLFEALRQQGFGGELRAERGETSNIQHPTSNIQ
ncbi:MAG TPA: tRNA (cytidine(34)-2'-O)-methyltransferase [Candidatus Acidoferrum sp.]|nr:tRNA (cytidine(34)-2'-O)-methyltransferase [Candidatus Acidoferrum sp.]